MTNYPSRRRTILFSALAFGLCATVQLYAQFGPGGGGGGFPFGGGGAFGANRQTASRTTRNYSGNGAVGDAVISIDPVTRNLIVIADEPTRAYISQVISNLDQPKPQVLIKVVFLEVTHNSSLDIGVEGAWGKSIGNSATGAVAHSFGGLSSVNTTNAPLNMFGQPISSFGAIAPITTPGAGLYQIFATDYQVTLRAIAQAGKAKILSRPSIVARNNQPATILVGQSFPLLTSVRYDSLGNAINGITYTDVGIILRVTPFITADGFIEMILSPEISSISKTDFTQLSAGVNGQVTEAPAIDKRSADTVVVTPDGQTVIIGGLIADAKADAESKIPLLGDIPILGSVFKRKVKTGTKTELLIFLTPTIIQAPTQFAAISNRESSKSGVPKGLTEQELNEYLDKVPMKTGPDATHKGAKAASDGYMP